MANGSGKNGSRPQDAPAKARQRPNIGCVSGGVGFAAAAPRWMN
jgi:hypothetical protein